MRTSSTYYDPFIVESLIMGYPVPKASTADKTRASQILRERGHNKDEIADILRTSPRHICRIINREVQPEQDNNP